MDSGHPKYIIRSMEPGVDVLTEKSIATDELKLQAIPDAEKRTGKKCIAGFNMRYAKLAWYINKMVFQKTWAASNNVDVVYGLDDVISPVIHHLGKKKQVDLAVKLQTLQGEKLEIKMFKNIGLEQGRDIVQLEGSRFEKMRDGIYAIGYELNNSKTK